MPYVTEEIYHLYFDKIEGKKSIHTSTWPLYYTELINEEIENTGDLAVSIIGAVRKFKSENNLSLKEELKKLIIECSEEDKKKIEEVVPDIGATTRANDVNFGKGKIEIGERLKIDIEL